MKKAYTTPEIKVVSLNSQDSVLTLSVASVKKADALKTVKKSDITF